MKIKLIENNWYLFIASYWKEYEVTEEEYKKIQSSLLKTKELNWVLSFEDDIDWITSNNIKIEEDIKKQKSIDIDNIATLSDQLNKMATEIYKLTEGSTNLETIENRKTFENIKTILNN